jgi:hypothetical protein
MTRKFAAAVAALLASFGGVAADATPVTVDFSVTSNDLSNPSYGRRPGLAYGRPVQWSVPGLRAWTSGRDAVLTVRLHWRYLMLPAAAQIISGVSQWSSPSMAPG